MRGRCSWGQSWGLPSSQTHFKWYPFYRFILEWSLRWQEGHQKLLSFCQIKGLVFGNFGEASEATHKLIDTIATSRVRVALPQTAPGRWGDSRSEEGEKAIALSYIRRRVSVAAVKLAVQQLQAGGSELRSRNTAGGVTDRQCCSVRGRKEASLAWGLPSWTSSLPLWRPLQW